MAVSSLAGMLIWSVLAAVFVQSKECPLYCKKGQCNMETGNCTDGCEHGKMGQFCSENCPFFCKDDVCDQYTGQCTDGCQDGYFGNTCRNMCHMDCRKCINDKYTCQECRNDYYGTDCSKWCPTNCKNRKCHQFSGACTSGCQEGYSGTFCNISCPLNCANCTQPDVCPDCPVGKYGKQCSQTCPAGCMYDRCNISNGECTDGCKPDPPVYDPKCSLPCPEGCLSCINNTHCLTCVHGFYGEICDKKCSVNCLSDVCDEGSGSCECKDSFHGEKCDLPCPESCLKCNSSDNCFECIQPFYGKTCAHICFPNCDPDSCIENGGSCTCVNGFYGDNSTVGSQCESKCSATCLNNTCDKMTGQCIYGCIAGVHGKTCALNCTETCGNLTCDHDNLLCPSVCRPEDYPCETRSTHKAPEQSKTDYLTPTATKTTGGLSRTVRVVLIVVGVLAGAILLTVLAICIKRRHARKTQETSFILLDARQQSF